MSAADPNREFAVAVVRRLQQAGYTALWAGGCVRDELLGLRPTDYDVATNALPEQVQELFGKRGTLAIGAAFGVILVRAPRGSGAQNVEVATFRTEGRYLDGRRPERVDFSTPEADAQRRDFTINGLFFDPLSAQLFDFVGGRVDLEARRVRAIGDPRERIREDKLRMLRAVRITARFDFELDRATADSVRELAPEVTVVSQERITQELEKMLVHPRRRRAVELATDLGLLSLVIPELAAFIPEGYGPDAGNADLWRRLLQTIDVLPSPGFPLALAALLRPLCSGGGPGGSQTVEKICRRLRLSNQSTDRCVQIVGGVDRLADSTQWTRAERKRILGDPCARDWIALSRAEAIGRGEAPTDAEACERFLDATPAEELTPPPLISGADLLSMQLTPGPKFKEILEGVYDAQLEGRVQTRAEAVAWAKLLSGTGEFGESKKSE